MSITNVREKCKTWLASACLAGRQVPRDALIVATLVLASSASFGLGYLAAPVPDIDCALSQSSEISAQGALNEEVMSGAGRYVASKNGTKYYLLSCSGADRISEENKIWFASVAAATAAGYTPAANCKGL